MDKAELKRIAVDAAVERVVGSSTVPARYVASLVKMMGGFVDEFKTLKDTIFSAKSEMEKRVKELEKAVDAYYDEVERLSQITKGDKGEAGDPGKDGNPGKDGRDAQEVDLVKLQQNILKLIREPKDGKDAILDEKLLEKMLDEKLKEYRLKMDNEVASYRSQLAGKVYGQDTWARGGGDTVKAGSNVVITTDSSGNKVINALGGGSGTNVTTQYQLTAVQAGSDVTIDLTQLTNWATFADLIQIIRNNVPQTEGIDFTFASPIVTINGADASEIFNATYAYS